MPTDYSFQAGWSRAFRTVSYSVNASRTRLSTGEFDNSVYMNVSVPLGRLARRASRAPQLSLSGSQTSSSGYGMQASVTGSAGERSQISYGVNGSYGESTPTNVGGNVSWRAPYVNLGASYSHGESSQNTSVTATGGLVVHRGGVTLASQLGDTIGIVKAKGAKGARLNSDNTTKVDGRGYVVTNNLMPYRMNEVNLDPKGSSLDVELENTRQQVAPRAGAVVAIEFGTKTGEAMLVRTLLEDGRPVPFGARVMDPTGNVVGIVGQGGQVFIRSETRADAVLRVEWGEHGSCALDAAISANADPAENLEIVKATCRSYQ